MKEIKRFSQFLENFLIIRDETILAKKKNSSSNTNIDETEKFSFSAQGYADGVVYNAEDFDQEILSSLPSPEQQAKIYGPGKTYSDEQIKKALSGDGTTENRSIRSPLRNYYLARERAKNILESFLDQLKATGSRLEKEIPTYDSAKQDFANLYAISEGNNSIKIENFKANCTGYCTPRRGALLNVHAPDFRLYSPHKEETVREIHPIFNSPNSSLQQKMNIHAIRTLFKEVEDFINGKSRIYAFPVATSEKNKILKLSSQAKEYFKSIPIFTSENKESNSSESSYYATITDEMYNKIEKNTSFNKNLISKFHLSDFSSFNKHVYESNNRLKENIKEKDIDNFLDDASKMYKEYIYAAQDFMKQSNVSSFTEEQFFIEFFRYKFNLSSNEVKKIYPLISWARSFFWNNLKSVYNEDGDIKFDINKTSSMKADSKNIQPAVPYGNMLRPTSYRHKKFITHVTKTYFLIAKELKVFQPWILLKKQSYKGKIKDGAKTLDPDDDKSTDDLDLFKKRFDQNVDRYVTNFPPDKEFTSTTSRETADGIANSLVSKNLEHISSLLNPNKDQWEIKTGGIGADGKSKLGIGLEEIRERKLSGRYQKDINTYLNLFSVMSDSLVEKMYSELNLWGLRAREEIRIKLEKASTAAAKENAIRNFLQEIRTGDISYSTRFKATSASGTNDKPFQTYITFYDALASQQIHLADTKDWSGTRSYNYAGEVKSTYTDFIEKISDKFFIQVFKAEQRSLYVDKNDELISISSENNETLPYVKPVSGGSASTILSLLNLKDAYADMLNLLSNNQDSDSIIKTGKKALIRIMIKPVKSDVEKVFYTPALLKTKTTDHSHPVVGFLHTVCKTGVTFKYPTHSEERNYNKEEFSQKYNRFLYQTRYRLPKNTYDPNKYKTNEVKPYNDTYYMPEASSAKFDVKGKTIDVFNPLNMIKVKHPTSYLIGNCSDCGCLKEKLTGDKLESFLTNQTDKSKPYIYKVLNFTTDYIWTDDKHPYKDFDIKGQPGDLCMFSPLVPQSHDVGEGGTGDTSDEIDEEAQEELVYACPIIDALDLDGSAKGGFTLPDVITDESVIDSIVESCKKNNEVFPLADDEYQNYCYSNKNDVCDLYTDSELKQLGIKSRSECIQGAGPDFELPGNMCSIINNLDSDFMKNRIDLILKN